MDAASGGSSSDQRRADDEPQDLSMKADDALAASGSDLAAAGSQDIYSLVQLDEPSGSSGAGSSSSRPSQQPSGATGSSSASSFTSPKKMMLLREAARESERMEIEDDRLATLAGVASQLVDSKSDSAAAGAPEILVVPNTSCERSEDSQDVSANVTVETSRLRNVYIGAGKYLYLLN